MSFPLYVTCSFSFSTYFILFGFGFILTINHRVFWYFSITFCRTTATWYNWYFLIFLPWRFSSILFIENLFVSANPKSSMLENTGRLTAAPNISALFSSPRPISNIPSSVAGHLLWSPFILWPHPQQITNSSSSKLPSPNSSIILASNTKKHCLSTTLSRPWRQESQW